jgi:hypothetical protein
MNVGNGWVLKKEISLPHLVTVVVLLVSIVGAYFIHEQRLTILEQQQLQTAKNVLELQVHSRKIDRLEQQLGHMSDLLCEVREELKQMNRRSNAPR